MAMKPLIKTQPIASVTSEMKTFLMLTKHQRKTKNKLKTKSMGNNRPKNEKIDMTSGSIFGAI
jgi:hypothetical protein